MIYDGKQNIFSHQDQYALIRLVNSEEEGTTKKHEEGKASFQLRLAKYLSTSGIGDILDLINVLFCYLITCIHLIYLSYWQKNTVYAYENNDILLIPELVCYFYFIADFSLNFYLQENKLLFAFQTTSLIEYVSVIPSLLAKLDIIQGYKYVYLTRVLRFLIAYRLDRFFQRRTLEVVRLTYKPIITICAIIFINATVLLVVEQTYQILDYIYFMVVTISTVGFGDVYPTTIYGRFSVIISILIVALVLPAQVQNLTKVLSLRSKYARLTYQQNEEEHILLLGSAQLEGFRTFLSELYHKDHGLLETNTVILQSNPPSEEMQLLLKAPQYINKIIYLEGHPLQKKDLERSNAEECKCIIVLANKNSRTPKRDDYRNIIHAFSVKQYVKKLKMKQVRVCLQVLQPSSKDLYFNSISGTDTDQVICVDELKMYLLAKTCLVPGINTLISFLIQSSKPAYDVSKYNHAEADWVQDYLCGMQNEIYRIPLHKETFVGLQFNQVSQAIFSQKQIILFALEVQIEGELRVFVNPAEYLLTDVLHYGYVIADEMPDVEELQNIAFPDYIARNFCFPLITKPQIQRNALQQETEQLKDLLSETSKNEQHKHQSFYFLKQSVGLAKVVDEKYENHFIVCGVVKDMKYLMMPLRARSLKTIQPIIILNPDPIPSEIQRQINAFPKIFYLQGSPLKIADLERACVTKAAALVILQKPHDQEDIITTIVDADTIFIYKTVKLLNPQINIITELASISTISFLQQSRNEFIRQYDWSVSEPFASGEIYISTMLDTLICQAYYNPFITAIFDQMILGSASSNKKFKKVYQQCKLQQSNLFLISVPPKFSDKTFGELYDSFSIDQKMIPIGLYRGEKVKNNNKPYVFLKPHPDVKLHSKDRVFVLSGKQPKEPEHQAQQHATNPQNTFTFKSKLQGEEGRVDIEFAKELWKLKTDMQGYNETLGELNQKAFNRGLIQEDFIPQIRQALRNELININQKEH